MAYNFPPNPSLNEIYSSNGRTFRWNGVQWVAIVAPTSNSAPVFVSSSEPKNPLNGALWFNTVDQTLYVRVSSLSGSFWTETYPGSDSPSAYNPPVKVSSTPPTNAVEGDLWFNPSISELKVKIVSLSGEHWELVGGYTPVQPATVEVSASPPSSPEQGQLWFNSTDGGLYVWTESVGGGGFWNSVSSSPSENTAPVFVSSSEPTNVPLGYLWFNPTTNCLKVKAMTPSGPGWDEVASCSSPAPQFAQVRVSASPPSNPENGDLWFNTSDNSLYVRVDTLGGGYWNLANEVPPAVNNPTIRISSSPPPNPVQGDLWYDPDDSNFSIWYEDLDGGQWVAVVPYPQEFLPIQGGTLTGPIYAGYDIPPDSTAFVTVGWVEDYFSQQAIPSSLLSAKGSLITASSENTPVELKLGGDGELLKVDLSTESGITWSNYVDCGAF
jgi:hypothetical protein